MSEARLREILEKVFKSDDAEFDMEHIEPRIQKALPLLLALTNLRPLEEKKVEKIIKDELDKQGLVIVAINGGDESRPNFLARAIASHFSKPQLLLEEVYIVGISDCEGNEIVAVCTTKEIAEKELFKTRDRLIAEWKEADIRNQETIKKFCEEKNKEVWEDTLYKDMITALSGDDYEKWDNYPHDVPYICKMKVMSEALNKDLTKEEK